MISLSLAAIIFGSAAIAGKAAGLVNPEFARKMIMNFPRSRLWGWALLTLDMIVVSVLLWAMPFPWFKQYRQALVLLCPISIFIIGFFADELLAPRALGGLLLLAAAPVLEAARLHPSQWRLVMTVLAYAWVFPGMLLVASPWWFRKAAAPVMKTNARCRFASAFGMALGVLLLALGIFVY